MVGLSREVTRIYGTRTLAALWLCATILV